MGTLRIFPKKSNFAGFFLIYTSGPENLAPLFPHIGC